ncbi:polysaccharide biosynthesis protein [Salinivibrio costicola]|uniref:polysaccharide biosynthesis protein n=1 Tax=Salinivibrio costicola TaxID=51367 RepID=UPI003F7107D3
MFTPIKRLLNASRRKKRFVTATYDVVAVMVSIYLAIFFRLGATPFEFGIEEAGSFLATVFATVFCFIKLGMYRAVLRYMTLPAIGHIFLAVGISAITLALSGFFFKSFIPRSVPFIYAGIAILTLGGPRILFRTLYEQYYKRNKPNVFIYGAGATGRDLAYALIQGNEYHPAAILDDDSAKVGQIMYGIRVYHPSEFDGLRSLYQPVKLLLAINNVTQGERLRLLEKLAHWPIEIQSVPSVEDIAAGKNSVADIKDLDIADLLGRAPVEPDPALLAKQITNKNVLVTGAGGSIGLEICQQALKLKPAKLILFELNEYNLYRAHQTLSKMRINLALNVQLVAALGSVQKEHRLSKLMATHEINTVYHTAAYKHVPLVEDNIVEGIRNNVFGTLACANAAIANKVESFTLISTDKAVRPTNIMGASKRLAELVLQALADKQSQTTFTMVRFGNVLGSSGSVVPLFKSQIRAGGPVTVTHPDITRYFMLIPEAAQLVIQASAIGHNGQVFVLDMGEPVKILDLAKRMIKLMGLREKNANNVDGDIEIKFTGLRPGEKLYEELLIGDNVEGTGHEKIMTACEEKLQWDDMTILLSELDSCCHYFDVECIKRILLEAPTGYMQPTNTKKPA